MDLSSLAKSARQISKDGLNPEAFDAKLPSRLEEIRLEDKLQRIYRRESAYKKQRDISNAVKIVQDSRGLSKDDKNTLVTAIQQKPNGLGRLIAAGISAISAPFVLKALGGDTTSSFAQAASIPVGAIGGVTLYDLLTSSQPQRSMPFKKAYPVVETDTLRRWTQ